MTAKPLDDMKPQDIAREIAVIFDALGDMLEKGGPSEELRDEWITQMRRAGELMSHWAKFGRWPGEERAALKDLVFVVERTAAARWPEIAPALERAKEALR